MTKGTITRLFVGGGIAVVAGAVFTVAAVWIAIANGVFVMNGPAVVGLNGGAEAWSLLGLAIVGAFTIMGGLITGLVSWIGALINTSQLESKAWFIGLLLLGIFSFGFFAMIAFLVAGPDGPTEAATRRAQAAAQAMPA